VIYLTDKKSVLRHQYEQAEPCRLVCREEDGVVTMIDLDEEIDLYAGAPGTTSARKIRAGKKNVAKILANARHGIPSWKRSLASVRGKKNKKLAGPEGKPRRRGRPPKVAVVEQGTKGLAT
jgi:hypothetical protein